MREIDNLVPYDKSWIIRMGFLDMINCRTQINTQLDAECESSLSTDLVALNRSTKQWHNEAEIDVGESGTLYRFLQFAAWHSGVDKVFKKSGTLTDRKITNNPEITSWPINRLLTLDNGTSQWASAAVLLGNKEARPEPTPYKLALTYDALNHWTEKTASGKDWESKKDTTIRKQALAYMGWLATGSMKFTPEQAEDYCFARAFDLISLEEGERTWPSLRTHESDRIAEMEVALQQATVDSADHRVVQAVAMLKGDQVSFSNPEAVNKSWPLFWKLIEKTT